jgi:hypothetical protein
MSRRVALVRTDVSEEGIASIIRLTRIGELGETLDVTINQRSLRRKLLVMANVIPSLQILAIMMMEAIRSSETSLLTKATQRHITEDGILQYQNWSQITMALIYGDPEETHERSEETAKKKRV